MSNHAMKRHGANLNAYYNMEEASLRRLHIVWFQLYDILEKAKLWRSDQKISSCRGGEEKREWRINGKHRGFLGQWNSSVWLYNGGYMTFCPGQSPWNYTTQRVDPNVNYGLQNLYWYNNYNKRTTLMKDVNNRGNHRREHMGTQYFLFNFSINLKLL